MTTQDKNSNKATGAGGKDTKKSARNERLKQSLRANLLRRKAKIRASRTSKTPEPGDKTT